ncbi:hypothetical protein L2735_01850 [Shewanella olleyana]|uniref:hypothetical protein n=1 Tax=Shewanella olleyana TaxID=135626 RepID=UPI00200FA1BA|nr:hypothetical protein [Shewanella olleyana]MCL1065558.1 hypothetical protein [Shewanella olleyana]
MLYLTDIYEQVIGQIKTKFPLLLTIIVTVLMSGCTTVTHSPAVKAHSAKVSSTIVHHHVAPKKVVVVKPVRKSQVVVIKKYR